MSATNDTISTSSQIFNKSRIANRDIVDLFKGIGVIIDDAFGRGNKERKDRIHRIKDNFERKNIPILTFSELPENFIPHFRGVSFVVLDWNLSANVGVSLPASLEDENAEFIKRLKKVWFGPIFVFTNEDINHVKDVLERNKLYDKESSNNHIFVKSKSEVIQARSLFSMLAKWVRKTPSIYLLKMWENSMLAASSELFNSLYNLTPSWPSIIHSAYVKDLGGKNSKIYDLIHSNLIARCPKTPLHEEMLIFRRKKSSKTRDELRQILEQERFLRKEFLDDYPSLGDLFLEKNKYYLNIRPDCDLIRSFRKDGNSDPYLYCIKGTVVSDKEINKKKSRYVFEKGAFIDRVPFTIIPFLDGGKIIAFKFEELEIRKWSDMKSKRQGRLLAPFLTRVKLQYIAYLQRQGIPSIPECSIF